MKKSKKLTQKPQSDKLVKDPIATYQELEKTLFKPIQFIERNDDSGEVDVNVDAELFDLTLKETTGTAHKAFGFSLLTQATLASCFSVEKGIEIANTVSAVMLNINPKDALEGMLAAQMVVVHYHAMECLKKANNKGQLFEVACSYRNQATKLMRTYIAQVEALKKYRTGGQQKMVVEHVHVHKGGQAIVGNVKQRGGGENEK